MFGNFPILGWNSPGGGSGGGGTFSLPIVRYVYLVQDASDATLMGGAAANVYTSAQAAYDAANTLQVLLGGTNMVVIQVGNTTAATVGGITLAANWNVNVAIAGISAFASNIGAITTSNAGGSGFTIGTSLITGQVKFSKVTIGNITTTATGAAGNGGQIGLLLDSAVVGNIDTSITNAVNLTGNGGNITITFNTNRFASTIGTITTSAKDPARNAGTVNIGGGSGRFTVGNITTANNNVSGSVTLFGTAGRFGNITVNGSTAAGNISVQNLQGGVITYTGNGAVTLTNSIATGVTINTIAPGGAATFSVSRSRTSAVVLSADFSVLVRSDFSYFQSITNLGHNSYLRHCIIDVFNGTGILGAIYNYGDSIELNNCFVRNFPGSSGVAIYQTAPGLASPINVNNTTLVGGTFQTLILNNYGLAPLPEAPAGQFAGDASVYSMFSVDLNGGVAGANVLTISNPICNKKIRVKVTNVTGADTLTVNIAGGVVTTAGGPYTPTPVPGAIDWLEITIDEGGNGFITPSLNFS